MKLMKVKHLDIILDSIIEEFLSMANEEDIKNFKIKYPEYTFNTKLENAIKEWSNNKISKEKSICRIIDFIEEKTNKNIVSKIDEKIIT